MAFVVVPDTAKFTGRLHMYVDGKRLGPVPRLAIVRPQREDSLLLLHCDDAWDVLGIQAWNAEGVERITSVVEMVNQAENFYSGLREHWVVLRH